MTGYWLAYYGDWSGFRIFDNEVDCLRYAVDHHMMVKFVPWGEDPYAYKHVAVTPLELEAGEE